METYGRTGRCLIELLLQQLDDPGAEPCAGLVSPFLRAKSVSD